MSADNWTTCHWCEKDRAEAVGAEERRVADLYGKVTVEQFDAARESLAALRAAAPERTFREDYEFWGAEDGIVEWSYKGRCVQCGASAEATGGQQVTR